MQHLPTILLCLLSLPFSTLTVSHHMNISLSLTILLRPLSLSLSLSLCLPLFFHGNARPQRASAAEHETESHCDITCVSSKQILPENTSLSCTRSQRSLTTPKHCPAHFESPPRLFECWGEKKEKDLHWIPPSSNQMGVLLL
mmetsp:Transcript_16762/g.24635  ORF Transcript_16762/g.24635 Transcript_16762/m.24635 type:complete len:142 (-) Transcript_16762:154-579(-)